MSQLNGKNAAALKVYTRSLTTDIHSSMGAILPNSAWRVIWALGQLIDEKGASRLAGYAAEDICVTGAKSGYNGIGGKTVVPAESTVRLDIVIPEGKTAEDVAEDVNAAFEAGGYGDVKASLF